MLSYFLVFCDLNFVDLKDFGKIYLDGYVGEGFVFDVMVVMVFVLIVFYCWYIFLKLNKDELIVFCIFDSKCVVEGMFFWMFYSVF